MKRCEENKMLNRTTLGQILAFIPVLCIVICVGGCATAGTKSEQAAIDEMRDILKKEQYIIHAAGEIEYDGEMIDYTNSYEALIHGYEMGNRIFEIDFLISEDNQIVCAHSWEDIFLNGEKMISMDEEHVLNAEWFRKTKVFGKFTPMIGDDVADFMRTHEEVYAVTDTKSKDIHFSFLPLLANSYPDLKDRFIVQVYHENEIRTAAELGFPYIILTMYKMGSGEMTDDQLNYIVDEHGEELLGFTFWENWTDDSDLYKRIQATGMPMYVHTVNDEERIQHLFEIGIDAVYTDRVDLQKE